MNKLMFGRDIDQFFSPRVNDNQFFSTRAPFDNDNQFFSPFDQPTNNDYNYSSKFKDNKIYDV